MIDKNELGCIISNFSSIIELFARTDWNFLWQGLFHAGPNHNAKIILKEQLRKIPGMGWVMAMSRFIYLKRTWSSDANTLDSMLDYFSTIRFIYIFRHERAAFQSCGVWAADWQRH